MGFGVPFRQRVRRVCEVVALADANWRGDGHTVESPRSPGVDEAPAHRPSNAPCATACPLAPSPAAMGSWPPTFDGPLTVAAIVLWLCALCKHALTRAE
jgi:hypothetical protein